MFTLVFVFLFLKIKICREIYNWLEEKSSIFLIMREKNYVVYYSFWMRSREGKAVV